MACPAGDAFHLARAMPCGQDDDNVTAYLAIGLLVGGRRLEHAPNPARPVVPDEGTAITDFAQCEVQGAQCRGFKCRAQPGGVTLCGQLERAARFCGVC